MPKKPAAPPSRPDPVMAELKLIEGALQQSQWSIHQILVTQQAIVTMQQQALVILKGLSGGGSVDEGKLLVLSQQVEAATAKLQAAISASQTRVMTMAKAVPAIDQLVVDVGNMATVSASAVAVINGISAQIAAAVAQATAGGASPADLAPLSDLSASLQQQAQALTDAMTTAPRSKGGVFKPMK